MKRLKRFYYSISFRITLIILGVCLLVSMLGGKLLSRSISFVSNLSECNRTADHLSTLIQDKVLQVESLLYAGSLAEENGLGRQQIIKVCQPLREYGLADSVYLLRKSEAQGEIKLRLEQQTEESYPILWSEPYFQNNRLVMTVFLELPRSKQLLCADINTEWQEQMAIYGPNMVANTIILSAGGKYVVHSDKKILDKNVSEASHKELNSDIKVFKADLENAVDSMLTVESVDTVWNEKISKIIVETGLGSAKRTIDHTGWQIICMMPADGAGVSDGVSVSDGVTVSDGDVISAVVLAQFGFLFSLLTIIIIFFVRRTVRPLRDITDATEDIAKGRFDVPLPKIRTHTEIRLLRDRFESMQHKLAEYVEDLKQTTEQKASMERDLQIAHEIQQGMLPQTFPAFPDRKDLDVFGLQLPARQVGGDLFDFQLRDETLYFCIGDVSGKGMPAALFMAVTCHLFRYALRQTSNPQEIVSAINNDLVQGNEQNMFCTLFVGVLDLMTGELSFCNAGHNAPLLLRRGECSTMPCQCNLPAGVFEDFAYKREFLRLEDGDVLFLYTDGVNEAENVRKEYFGDEATIEAVAAQAGLAMQPMAENILHRVQTFTAEAEQSDDLTILCLKYNRQA